MRFDLGSLDVAVGGAKGLDLRVPVEDFELAGQRYAIEPESPSVRLDVVRSIGGRHLRIRSDVTLVGPCWRCLEEARIPLAVEGTEFAGDGTIESDDDEELESEYLTGDELELDRWLRDTIAEAVPPTIVCGRDDCEEPAVDDGGEGEDVDPRWAPLEELAERLRSEGS